MYCDIKYLNLHLSLSFFFKKIYVSIFNFFYLTKKNINLVSGVVQDANLVSPIVAATKMKEAHGAVIPRSWKGNLLRDINIPTNGGTTTSHPALPSQAQDDR